MCAWGLCKGGRIVVPPPLRTEELPLIRERRERGERKERDEQRGRPKARRGYRLEEKEREISCRCCNNISTTTATMSTTGSS